MSLFSSFSSFSKDASSSKEKEIRNGYLLLTLAVILGAIIRFAAPLTRDFVVVDGGLFYLFAQEIRASHFVLPATVPYGTVEPTLPFCYPPLSFYVIALLSLLGIPLEWSLRYLPAAFSVATIWAVWRLTKTIVEDLPKADLIAGLAAFFFAFLPWGFLWMVMGGGISRSPGLFFAVWGVERAISFWRDGENKAFWQTTLLLGITLLLHLERARFLFFAVLLVWLVYNRKIQGAKWLPVFLGGGLLISSPWWTTCLVRFGLQPFLASYASGSGDWVQTSRFTTIVSFEYFFPAITILSILGLLFYWKKLPFLWIWCLAIVYLELRSGRNFIAIPLAMGVALAIIQINSRIWQTLVFSAAALWLLFQSSVTAYSYASLDKAQIEGMLWCQQNTPKDAAFLVAPTNKKGDWSNDILVEWFPALALRASRTTPQGTEWLKKGTFGHQIYQYRDFSKAQNWEQLQKQAAKYQTNFDWIYFSKRPMRARSEYASTLQNGILNDKNWVVKFENSSVLILMKRTQTETR